MRDYLKKVLELTRPYRGRLVLGLLCGAVSGTLAFTLPLSLKLAVDAVFPQKTAGTNSAVVSKGLLESSPPLEGTTNRIAIETNASAAAQDQPPPANQSLSSAMPKGLTQKFAAINEWVRPGGRASTFRVALVISFIPASMFLRNLVAYLNVYLLSWVGIRAANDLRLRLFKHLVNLPLGFFNDSSTGDLMTRIEGAFAVNTTIKDSLAVIIRAPVTLITTIGGLLWLEPRLTLLTLFIFPICLVPLVVFGRKFRKSDHGIHSRFANLNKVMHEAFTGMRVIKAYNLETTVVEEFRQATAGLTSFFMRTVRAGELPGPMIEFIGSLGVALVFTYFAFMPRQGGPQSSTMLAFFIAVFGLYEPLKSLSRLNHQLMMARATVDPVYHMLEVRTTLPEPSQPKPLQAHSVPIRFENVSFSYGEKAVLQKISLTIQPGQLIALVGRTGSGKTSIANLLLRFYDPQSGSVFIGDTDVREVSSRELRANIAVVTQETILFNDTIRHNIALGRPGAANGEIEEAAKHAYAHEFIKDKPHGYDTWVGEKGGKISGGQRQRIAIARAILKNAPILILDEATNSLDAEAERIVQTALEDLMKGRTTICIAHRLSTIQKADLIVVLDEGRIVETGTHEQLLKAQGLYSKLYELSRGNGE